MEASVTAGQGSIYGRTSIKGTPSLNVKPFFGFFYKPISRLSRMHSCHINRPANRVSNEIFAAADFSRRKPRKVSSSQSRGPGKGFVPKTQAETGTLKKGRPSKEKSRSVSSPRQMNRRVPEVRVDNDDNLASGTSQGMNVEEELNDGIKGKVLPESEPVAIVSNNELKENVSISAISDSPSATILVEEQVKNEANTAVETGLDGFSGSEEYVVLGSGINKVADENVSAYKLMKSGNEVRSAVVWTRPDALDGSEDVAFVESYEGREAKEKVSEWKSISEIEAPVMIRQESVDNVCEKATQESDKTREAGENAGKVKVLSENKAQVASVATLPDIIEGSGDDLIFDIHDNRETEEIVSETKIIKSEVCSSDVVAYNVEEMGSSSQVIHAGMDAFVHEDCPSVLVEDASDVFTGEGSRETNESISLTEVEKSETLEGTGPIANKAGEEKFSKSLKSEMEALVHKEVIEELAEDNFSRGNNLFTYPQAVKPDQEIEIFFNRSLSTLKHEPDVMIMGAYNDWRWKSFTVKLDKSHFSGDWWSCHIHVPKEAYGIDFVFFNGKDVYDNNNRKDFHIYVEGGMDADSFEDFLLEEKLRELEKLAKEQTERERIEEENRRFAEENAAKEADRSQAKLEVQRRREKLIELINKAKKSADNIWYLEPSNFKDKDMVRLYYNRSSGPLAEANDIWIHGGHNGWADGLSIVAKLVKSERMDADWWYTEVTVPEGAIILDWVFADGPPKLAHCYDNNHHQDFHGVFPNSLPGEAYWIEEEEQIYQKLQDERRQRELVIRAKAEKTANLKAETRKQTVKRFLLSQKHIVYTDPLDVRAGSLVTIYYNPANTVLSGKTEIWFRCSFNRWTHRNGLLPPQKMVLAENASHFKTTVKVPLDSYVMDFVFSEREGGGVFDNKDGMDYHVPVYGGVTKEPPMHIVHIAVEMAPIAKVGGLGDVVTSLSRAVKDLKHHVDIILPKYDCLNLSVIKDLQYNRSFSWGGTEIKVWCGKVEGLFVYFLEPQNGFFWKGCVYGCGNDAERFGFFCHAALEFLLQTGLHPDIIHCHDWSSAPVAWLYKDHYRHYGLSKARVVFTIHNLEFGAQLIGKAMQYSDKATTVSHTYSKEIAGHPAIAPYLYKFHGILNGIDPDIWDPFNDKFIPVHYTSENVIEGKKAAKEALQRRLGLKVADIPLVGIISRLTHQKGIHLIKHAIWRTLERNGQVVLLGSAPDPRIQNDFVNLANQLHSSHNDRARFCLTYDEPLSHLIYAGADFIVVPSMFEPCGLTQLVAMRYGAIPVVRKTGGLYDTVYDVDHDKERAEAQGLEPNGFSFEGADASGIDYALNRAISAWYDGPDWFYSLCKRVMDQDWSWNRPALDYLELYHAARKY